jgi:hypothetical protein
MLCCIRCFDDIHQELIKFIKENGKPNRSCDYCGSRRTYVIEPHRLESLFTPLLSCYEVAAPGVNMIPDEDAIEVGELLPSLLQEDFSLFSQAAWSKVNELLDRILNDPMDIRDGGYAFDTESLWCRREQNFTERSEVDLWDTFSNHLQHERRFIPDEHDPEIFDPRYGLSAWLPKLERLLPASTRFYRGRRDRYILDEMGAPSHDKASAGRANPEGIPFLYLASDIDTVIAELRPEKGLTLSIAEFTLSEEVRIVDLSESPANPSPFGFPEGDNLYILMNKYALLRHLNVELARPICQEKPILLTYPRNILPRLFEMKAMMACCIKVLWVQGRIWCSSLLKKQNQLALATIVSEIFTTQSS